MNGSPLPPWPKNPRRPGRVNKQQFVEVTIYRSNTESRVQSRMIDVSPTGVGLLHPDRLLVGDQFSVNVIQPGGNRIKFLYHVAYCKKDKRTGKFHVGGEFICTVALAV